MKVSAFAQSWEAAMSQRALPGFFCFYLFGEVPEMFSVVLPVKHKITNRQRMNGTAATITKTRHSYS